MTLGAFAGVALIYVAGSGGFLLWREYEVRRTSREDVVSGDRVNVVVEKTNFILKVIGFLYIGLAGGVFAFYEASQMYSGPLWIPYAVDVPALIFGLYFSGYLQVGKWPQSAYRKEESEDFPVAKYGGRGHLFMASFVSSLFWPPFIGIVSFASVGLMDWASLSVMVVVPEVCWIMVMALGFFAPKW